MFKGSRFNRIHQDVTMIFKPCFFLNLILNLISDNNEDFGKVYTASFNRGTAVTSIIIPHANRLMYYECKNFIKITLMDRILVHGKRPRSGTVAAIKLLEAIRVNTHSLMTVQTYDESNTCNCDLISLFIDINDKERVENIISKFVFRYTPSTHWNYWLKRWLLSFEEGEDDSIIEKPLYKDTNTVKMEMREYAFQPMNENHEWIAVGPEFKITFKFIEEKSRNVHYILVSKFEGNDVLGSISEAIRMYLFHVSRILKPISTDMLRAKNLIRVCGDPVQFITVLNAYITTHPIEVASIIISDLSPIKLEVMDDQ